MAYAQWWWCLTHRRAESDPDTTGGDRMGPYPTEQAAQAAMQTVAARNEAWDSDPAWHDD